jgi:hypothetical protein
MANRRIRGVGVEDAGRLLLYMVGLSPIFKLGVGLLGGGVLRSVLSRRRKAHGRGRLFVVHGMSWGNSTKKHLRRECCLPPGGCRTLEDVQ